MPSAPSSSMLEDASRRRASPGQAGATGLGDRRRLLLALAIGTVLWLCPASPRPAFAVGQFASEPLLRGSRVSAQSRRLRLATDLAMLTRGAADARVPKVAAMAEDAEDIDAGDAEEIDAGDAEDIDPKKVNLLRVLKADGTEVIFSQPRTFEPMTAWQLTEKLLGDEEGGIDATDYGPPVGHLVESIVGEPNPLDGSWFWAMYVYGTFTGSWARHSFSPESAKLASYQHIAWVASRTNVPPPDEEKRVKELLGGSDPLR
mmetsp:Transcript_23616/g.52358  ORF Transcript_23616/g.52358 Transcript_23616/m.52358 type:complete len:260 (+) Transcript_23616:35-814(+)